MNRPIHTQNHRFRVVEEDGSRIPDVVQYGGDVLDPAPAERKTVEFEADADPGVCLMRCHTVSHAMNGDSCPGGMVGGIVYESAMESDVLRS
jgi:FtsP/CotA-like multicopper oxidase with cupredoxin domain